MNMADHQNTISALNDLLQKNVDARHGYHKAGEDINHASLETYLEQKSAQRQRFTNELESEIVSLGGEPKRETSVKGSLHHAWIDLKSSLSSNNEEAVFEECIRGEKHSLKDYDSKLEKESFPPSTKSLLTAQRNQVEADLKKAQTLEELSD